MWAADTSRREWRLKVQVVRSDKRVTIDSSVFVPESVLSFTISYVHTYVFIGEGRVINQVDRHVCTDTGHM